MRQTQGDFKYVVSIVLTSAESSTADDATSAPSPTSTSSLTTTSESAVAATSASSTTLEATSTDSLIEATQVAGLRASDHCGTDDRLILPGFAWTVSNAMYNADQMVGTQCTNFEAVLQTTDGTQDVQWNSVTDIDFVESTKDLCKGYSNIGIGVNLKKQLKDITSIPASFRWERSNTTDFRGANVFDFITAPTAGDSSSTSTSEFMLWLQIWGNQVPIGYASGPVATFDLYDASWRLYEGVNPASGVTVRSMLVDTAFDGEFQGDLKDWLEAMVQAGYIADTDYVNVGNAGSEVFYGSAVMNATVSLNINI
ncbi:putative endoglucanase-1 precursor [Xylariales sp. AK1849]|nr:putative endoglucanase-1 precursor [Xylariales sp. AK1849]